MVNPQEIAEYILNEAVRRNNGRAEDDMTVIAAGIWERSVEVY